MKMIALGWLLAVLVVPLPSQADDQSDRVSFIERLTSKGIFQSVGIVDDVPRLVVSPDFYDSDFESKQTAVGIVYQYYFMLDSAHRTLLIIDGATGAQIGTFSADGLQL